ncbi:hypothetical protein ACJX0J_022270, partial [Zea mays]
REEVVKTSTSWLLTLYILGLYLNVKNNYEAKVFSFSTYTIFNLRYGHVSTWLSSFENMLPNKKIIGSLLLSTKKNFIVEE